MNLPLTRATSDRGVADFIDSVPLPVLVCADGVIRSLNDAAREFLGANYHSELVGVDFLRCVQPQDLSRIEHIFLPTPVRVERKTVRAVRLTRLDGTEVAAGFKGISMPDGSTTLVIQPIDERDLHSEMLVESEARHRMLVEDSPDGIILESTTGDLLFANKAAAELFGFSNRQDLLSAQIGEFCAKPTQRDPLKQALARQGFIKNFEYEIKRRNGQRRTVLESSSVMRDARGNTLLHRCTFRDITEWKQLQNQLFQAQKMESLEALIGGIAHDFMNVLNTMRGFAGRLKLHPIAAEKIAKYADAISKSTERGIALAHRLFSLTRRKRHVTTTASVQEVISEVVVALKATLHKSIRIESSVSDDVPFANVDPGELYQALLNLCTNAEDAMPNGGVLRLEATYPAAIQEDRLVWPLESAQQDFVAISVGDTGTGIAENIRERIFDPFFTTKERGKGTGLGLSIVYNTTKSYNGAIVVETEEHRGSTFTMLFPKVEARMLESRSNEAESPKPANNELILLVDDETIMQELGRELLEEQGYRVMVATDGVEAVEIYRQYSKEIDLVILDLLMPRLDGGQAFLELKKINKNVRAFFCTGYTPRDVVGSILKDASLETLQKPFHPEELLGKVRKALATN
ncbi:MAG: PAS domain S-box protein [Ignavibacteriae bacterium]|nr:PAS domain S-box protein [Ignavibacteriota bacterium]